MKKYRRSFWAASCVNSMIIPWIVAFVFSYLVTRESVDPSIWFSFYGLLFGGIPTLALLTFFIQNGQIAFFKINASSNKIT